jgi:hypothetical protein
MAMLRALPRDQHGLFVSELMRKNNLLRTDVEAPFHVEQEERTASHGPLLIPAGDAALRAQSSTSPPPQNLPGVVCAFCGNNGHEEAACFARNKAMKEAQERTKENKAGKKDRQRANRAEKEASKDSKPAELAASASLRLAGSPDTHADAHWIADMGATSHMSPRRAWFTPLEPLAIPIRVANNQVVYSKGVGTVLVQPADPSMRPLLLSKLVHGRKPDYSMFRVFGCRAWAHVHKKERKHLENHAKPCVFLGLPDNFKGWKLRDPLAQGNRGGIIVSRDVIWNESEFPGTSRVATDPIPPRFGRALRPGEWNRPPRRGRISQCRRIQRELRPW